MAQTKSYNIAAFKKIAYKKGAVIIEFIDGEGNAFKIKSFEQPHPEFIQALKYFSSVALLALETKHNIKVDEINFVKDNGLQLCGYSLFTNIAFDFKILLEKIADIFNIILGEEEILKFHENVDKLKSEANAFLAGKSAQLEIEYSEEIL